MDFNEQDFKHCLGSFASGVTVVTIIDASNKPQGVTISSFSSLSLEPPMIAFNLGKETYLHSKLLNSNSFAINILSQGQMALSRKFAIRSEEKWNNVTYQPGMHGCPLLEGSIGYIECLTDYIYDGGDHSIITGRIVNLKSSEEQKPLIHYKGGYYALGEKIEG